MEPKDLPLTEEGKRAVSQMVSSVLDQIHHVTKDTPENSLFTKSFVSVALRHKVAALLTGEDIKP